MVPYHCFLCLHLLFACRHLPTCLTALGRLRWFEQLPQAIRTDRMTSPQVITPVPQAQDKLLNASCCQPIALGMANLHAEWQARAHQWATPEQYANLHLVLASNNSNVHSAYQRNFYMHDSHVYMPANRMAQANTEHLSATASTIYVCAICGVNEYPIC